MAYNYLGDRVLIKTYLPKELPCVPRKHEAESMPIAFSQLDKGSRKTRWVTCNVGFWNEHPGHEEGNEAGMSITHHDYLVHIRRHPDYSGHPSIQPNILVPFG